MDHPHLRHPARPRRHRPRLPHDRPHPARDHPPRLTVDGTGQEPSRGFFTFIPDNSVGLAFSDQQLMLIRQVLREPHFTILRFRRTADAEAAITALDPTGPILIDNDHGLLLSLDEVKHRIAMKEEWLEV